MKTRKLFRYLLLLTVVFVVLSMLMPMFAYGNSRANVEAFVVRFYQQCLGRAPDAAGLNSWTDQLLSGRMSGAQVANGFIFSAELNARNVSNEEFLNIMYAAFFNRAPDPTGYSGWLSSMRAGMSRQQVLAGFINSTEFRNLCSSYGINAGSLSVSGALNTASAPQTAASPAASANLNAYEARVLELLNAIRASHGLGALSAHQGLTNIARARSADMVARNYFSHTTPDGTNVFSMIRSAGISYSVAGENLAHARPAGAGSPEAFVNAWMASPGHRANILRANYSKIGIGLVDEGSARRVVTNVFSN
jgi:uncharacterized protein YkwD